MRFNEFNKNIYEVAMNPKSLKKSAKNLNILCGIEFEMYFPHLTFEEIPDLNEIWCYSINEIIDFFEDFNSYQKLDNIHKEYQESLRNSKNDLYDERDWFEEIGLQNMADAMREFNLNYINDDDFITASEYASKIEEYIGHYTRAGERYHSLTRDDYFILEPDSSLDDAPDKYYGAELISPPMPLPEIFTIISQVTGFAKEYNCITNESCGLHINMSLQDVDFDDIDLVKLVLFLGDNYILSKFKRDSNNYCMSMFEKLKQKVGFIQNKFEYLNIMKDHIDTLALNSLLLSASTDRRVSINPKEDYIEFRSPGGDWLNTNLTYLEATIHRFAVALDIASDPEKYKEEYLKKLYKLFNPSKIDEIDVFVHTFTGTISKDELKNSLLFKQNYLARTPTQKSDTNSYIITAPNNKIFNIQGVSVKDAIKKLRTSLHLNSTEYPDNVFKVEPSKQTDIFHTFKESINKNIESQMLTAGFQKIAAGMYSSIYTKPNINYVIKIFKNDPGYLKFLEFISKNKSNIHLPKIGKIQNYDNNEYAIQIEKLNQISESVYNKTMHIIDIMINYPNNKDYDMLINKFSDLYTIAMMIKYLSIDNEDLSIDNFMMRNNTPVLIDPWG